MEKAGNSSAKKSYTIQWSLYPVLIYTKICGIPSCYYTTPRNPNKRVCSHLPSGYSFLYIGNIPSLICLLINCFFQIFHFVERITFRFLCGLYSLGSLDILYVPVSFANLCQVLIEPMYITGVPLAFAFHFYCTKKFQNIWNSIQKIEEEIVLPKSFYYKCRKRCLFLIAISSLV